MFLGHFAVAFASKKVAPALPLSAAFAAAQLPDLLWPILLLSGAETVEVRQGLSEASPLAFTSYPWSHSLLMDILFGAVLGAFAWRRWGNGAALAAAALVVSHWVLDWITHVPDLPLAPGAGPLLGLGLWNSLLGTLVVEVTLFAGGVLLYLQATRPVAKAGRWALAALLAFLFAIYAGALFGPPPPTEGATVAIAIPGLAMWLLVAWAGFIDRRRIQL